MAKGIDPDLHPKYHKFLRGEEDPTSALKAPIRRYYYTAPKKNIAPEPGENLGIADDGTYIVVWASVARDLTALFFEGVGIAIFGHVVSLTAIMMILGISLGLFGLRLKTKHIRKR